jgi:hypothetical protein
MAKQDLSSGFDLPRKPERAPDAPVAPFVSEAEKNFRKNADAIGQAEAKKGRITAYVSQDLERRVKIRCAETSTNISDAVAAALEGWLLKTRDGGAW